MIYRKYEKGFKKHINRTMWILVYLALPIVSFNGTKYDINLMKRYLHNSLENIGETVTFAI